jgi:MFS family permease
MTDISAAIEPAVEPAPVGRLSARAARRRKTVATVLAVVGAALAVAILRFGTAGDQRFQVAFDAGSIAPLGTTLLYPLVGALIIQRRPSTRVAWVMIAMGIGLGLGFALYGYGTLGMPPRPPLPGAFAAIIFSQFFFVPTLATGTTLFFLLFPSDRFLDQRWRAVLLLSLLGMAIYTVATAIRPGALDEDNFPGVMNPLGAPETWRPALDATVVLGNIALLTAAGLGVVSLVLRYGRGDRIERAQIRWIALVGVFVAASFTVAAFQLGEVSDRAWELGFAFLALLPIAIGIAITRYYLYDIDRLINRTLVYGALTAILAGIFTAGIGLAQRLFVATTGEKSDAAIVLTTLVVATAYAPLRRRLESIIDRWFKYEHRRFGAYRDEVVRILGVLEPTRAAERLVAETVRELEATGGAVVDGADTAIATAGTWPVASVVRLPIPGGGPLHALLVGPRADGRPHDPRTIAHLEDTVGLVANAVGLTHVDR